MAFLVSEPCRLLGLRAGAVVLRDLNISSHDEALRRTIQQEAQAIRTEFPNTRAIRELPEIREFYQILRKVGVNPKAESPSVERLLSFILKRGDLPAINNLVDAYNLVSIRSRCSLGAHDLDRIKLPVALRHLTGNESFTALGQTVPEPVSAREFGYVDACERVLCRLDLRQAEFSKVTTETRNALLIIEGTVAHSKTKILQAFDDAIEVVTRHCGGNAEIVALPVGEEPNSE